MAKLTVGVFKEKFRMRVINEAALLDERLQAMHSEFLAERKKIEEENEANELAGVKLLMAQLEAPSTGLIATKALDEDRLRNIANALYRNGVCAIGASHGIYAKAPVEYDTLHTRTTFNVYLPWLRLAVAHINPYGVAYNNGNLLKHHHAELKKEVEDFQSKINSLYEKGLDLLGDPELDLDSILKF